MVDPKKYPMSKKEISKLIKSENKNRKVDFDLLTLKKFIKTLEPEEQEFLFCEFDNYYIKQQTKEIRRLKSIINNFVSIATENDQLNLEKEAMAVELKNKDEEIKKLEKSNKLLEETISKLTLEQKGSTLSERLLGIKKCDGIGCYECFASIIKFEPCYHSISVGSQWDTCLLSICPCCMVKITKIHNKLSTGTQKVE